MKSTGYVSLNINKWVRKDGNDIIRCHFFTLPQNNNLMGSKKQYIMQVFDYMFFLTIHVLKELEKNHLNLYKVIKSAIKIEKKKRYSPT